MSNEIKYTIQEIARLYKGLPEEHKEEAQKKMGLYRAPIEKRQGFFKIMHKPSGLFYQVITGGNNLAIGGKVYTKIGHAKSAYNPEKGRPFTVQVSSEKLKKILRDLGYSLTGNRWSEQLSTPASEWEIVEV